MHHPPGAREMGIERLPGAIGFAVRIKMQHYSCNVTPIGTVRFSVEQSQIRDKVLMVVGGQYGTGGRDVCDIGIKGRHSRIDVLAEAWWSAVQVANLAT
jgi:hypothetical protein